MNKSNPSIAIIIPVYNVVSFLFQAIQSAVNQKYSNKEIIVIDDGSDEIYREEIKNICREFDNVRLFHIVHSGVVTARNYGVSVSNSAYIVFFDADDILLPHALGYFAKALKPGIAAVYAQYATIDEKNNLIKKPKPLRKLSTGKKVLSELLKAKISFCNGCICIDKKILQNIPQVDHTLSHGEDWLLWCYIALAGDIIPASNRIVVLIRKHRQNVSDLLLEDPSSLYKAIEIIYSNPAIIDILGHNAEIIKRRNLSGINLYLASHYAQQSDKEKASFYLEKAEMLLSEVNISLIETRKF